MIFGTQGCHLCDEAELMIGIATCGRVAWQTIDIADDPVLLTRYGERIPVLRHEASGVELDWPFDAGDILRLLDLHSG